MVSVTALPTENPARRRHRLAQGDWRSSVGWPAGAPTDKRVAARFPTLPNYFAEQHEGRTAEDAGLNLMSEAARCYARRRVQLVKALGGTAEPARLYRNLLSSQPLAFSIAGELRSQPAAAAATFDALLDRDVTGVTTLAGPEEYEDHDLAGVEAEWFPPRHEHTGDRSGFDVAACLELSGARRLLVSVEVKYVDPFGAKALDPDRYAEHLDALGLDRAATEELVAAGCSQVLRQLLLTDSVRRRGLAPGSTWLGRVDEAVVAVLSRADDERARDVVAALAAAQRSVPVVHWSFEQLLDAAAAQPALAEWAGAMRRRYVLPD